MSFQLDGRNAVVFGVANKRSIAWSIAQGLHAAGMKLAITYQNERLEQEAKDLILSLPGAEGYMCDVSKDEDIDRLFATLKERHGNLHALVHSVAYAPADELKGDFLNTTREGFRVAMDVSVYSLVAVARAGRLAGVPVKVYVSNVTVPAKLAGIRSRGAELVVVDGPPLEAELAARRKAAADGLVYISPYNDLDVIAGQGTWEWSF